MRLLPKIDFIAAIFCTTHSVAPAYRKTFHLRFPYLNMIKICKAGELRAQAALYRLDLLRVKAAISSAFWNNSPCCTWISARFLQAQLPSRSLQADNVSDMPVSRDMDWTPFSALLDRESCWQAAAEKQSSVYPFEAQQTLKEQHKQIQVQGKVPHVITENATCSSLWFWLKSFPTL